jgi:hypothetical protein
MRAGDSSAGGNEIVLPNGTRVSGDAFVNPEPDPVARGPPHKSSFPVPLRSAAWRCHVGTGKRARRSRWPLGSQSRKLSKLNRVKCANPVGLGGRCVHTPDPCTTLPCEIATDAVVPGSHLPNNICAYFAGIKKEFGLSLPDGPLQKPDPSYAYSIYPSDWRSCFARSSDSEYSRRTTG